MYLATLLNKHGLFQHFGGWPGPRSDRNDLSDFLFRGTCALVHLLRIEELHSRCLQEFGALENSLDIARDHIVLGSASVVSLVSEVPPLLATMGVMQNMVLPMVARALPMVGRASKMDSIASSLGDAVGKLHTYGLPESMKKRTLLYWQGYGRSLKDYRDVDQHHEVIVNNTLLQLRPERKMRVFLPDNPGIKSAKKFAFSGRMDAIEYLPRVFRALHDYVEDLAKLLGCSPKPHALLTRTDQLSRLEPTGRGTLALIVDRRPDDGAGIWQGIELHKNDGEVTIRQVSAVAGAPSV